MKINGLEPPHSSIIISWTTPNRAHVPLQDLISEEVNKILGVPFQKTKF